MRLRSKPIEIIPGVQPNLNFLQINFREIKQLGIENAVVLQYIENKHLQRPMGDRINRPWIHLPAHELKQVMGLSPDTQRRILKKLVKAGNLEVKREGLPSTRYVRYHHPEHINFIEPKIPYLMSEVADGELTRNQAWLISLIQSSADSDGWSRITDEEIAGWCRLPVKSVRHELDVLQLKERLQVKVEAGNRLLWING